jgi:regulator of sirC expression with transglutaminase-like and TPR domain
MDRSELNAMISLLEDNDMEIIKAVTESLLSRGTVIVPELERAWEMAPDEKLQERIENLIQTIQFNSVKEDLKRWVQTGSENILEGAFYIARFNFPDIKFKIIDDYIEKIKMDVWLEINNNLTALEKIRIINYIIYDLHKFSRNQTDFYSPQNSYINQVIDAKKGNPISLAIIYLSVAWKLGLPIYGVNLPKNFILAFKDESAGRNTADESGDILFYINPYNKGAVLGRKEIDYFITQQQLEPLQTYFIPCSNRDIIIRLINNLMISYEKSANVKKIDQLKILLEVAMG